MDMLQSNCETMAAFFPARSSASKSEIVVPLFKEGKVTAVLDIDSEQLATFDETDKLWLERIVELL